MDVDIVINMYVAVPAMVVLFVYRARFPRR
jgi:hypothetical protein